MKTTMLFSTFPFILSDRVTLSRMSEIDAAALWEILGDDETYRYNPGSALKDASEVNEKIKKYDKLFTDRESVVLGIFANDNLNRLLGTLQISDIDDEVNCVTISFAINRVYSGRGYGTAAVKAVCKYLIETADVNRIQAYTMPTNAKSQRVLLNCGFTKEGTIREAFLWPDKGLLDLNLYSLLKSEYKALVKKGDSANKSNIMF